MGLNIRNPEAGRHIPLPCYNYIVYERFKDENGSHLIFHCVFGRRVNEALSTALAYAMARFSHRDVEITATDNGFMLSSSILPLQQALTLFKSNSLRTLLSQAIDNSELFRRRFRHCATRALMILRSYGGRTKSVGAQYMSSYLLLNAVRLVSQDFPILKETRREVMEDVMDLKNAEKVVSMVNSGIIKLEELPTIGMPSPFAWGILAEGRTDLVRMESKVEFIRRMHLQLYDKMRLFA